MTLTITLSCYTQKIDHGRLSPEWVCIPEITSDIKWFLWNTNSRGWTPFYSGAHDQFYFIDTNFLLWKIHKNLGNHNQITTKSLEIMVRGQKSQLSVEEMTCYNRSCYWENPLHYKQGKSEGFDSWDQPSNLTQTGLKYFFQPVWPCNLMDDIEKKKKNRAPLLYYLKLCVTFQIHQWIQTGVTVWKHSVWVKIGNFFLQNQQFFLNWLMTLKKMGHLFYVTPSFLHHFVAIGEPKLELQSGKA